MNKWFLLYVITTVPASVFAWDIHLKFADSFIKAHAKETTNNVYEVTLKIAGGKAIRYIHFTVLPGGTDIVTTSDSSQSIFNTSQKIDQKHTHKRTFSVGGMCVTKAEIRKWSDGIFKSQHDSAKASRLGCHNSTFKVYISDKNELKIKRD